MVKDESSYGAFSIPDFQFSFQLYAAHANRVSSRWSYPMHDHPFFEINLVIEGSQTFQVDGREFAVHEGDVLFLSPGIPHCSRVSSSSSMTYFCVHFDVNQRYFFHELNLVHPTKWEANSEVAMQLRPVLDEMMDHARNDGESSAGYHLRVQASVFRLAVVLATILAQRADERSHEEYEDHGGWTEPKDVIQMRKMGYLEKHVQDLFYEPADFYDETLFPNFHWIFVLSVYGGDSHAQRYAIKRIFTEILIEYGTPVVVFDERVITCVAFIRHFTLPDVDALRGRIQEQILSITPGDVEIKLGGVSPYLADVGHLFRQSLQDENSFVLDIPMSHTGAVHPLVRSAVQYLRSDYWNPDLSLGLLAERLYVHPNYLSNLFKVETGLTFSQTLTNVRIERAQSLLKESSLKIYQISEKVGYSDASYFARIFKNVVGVTPVEFRDGFLK